MNSQDTDQELNWDLRENISPRIEYFGNEPDGSVSVFIADIPPGLDEGGLYNLLLACAGRPLDLRMIKDLNGNRRAFADFSTIKAVTKVIQDLNNKAPLYLQVKVAKSKRNQGKGSGTAGRIEDTPPTFLPQVNRPPSSYPPPTTWSVGRGGIVRRSTSVHRAYKAHMQAQIVHDSRMWSTGPGDVYDADRFMYVPRDAHEEVNLKLLNSVQITTRCDGRRTLSMGRGYYVYPKRRPTTKAGPSQTKQYYDNVSKGVYSFGKDVEAPAIPCSCCKTLTIKKCSECCAAYCSEECQGRDWNNHKNHCKINLYIGVIPDGMNGDTRMITLRPLSDPMKTDVVHTEVPARSPARASAIDVMRQNVPLDGVVEISRSCPDSKVVYGTLCCTAGSDALTKLVTGLPSVLENSLPVPGFSPEKGSMIAIWNQRSWWRGTVVTAPSQNFDEYRVAVTELAKTVTVKRCDLRPLPPAFADLPELGIKGLVISSNVQETDLWSRYLQVGDHLEVHMESAEGSTITCSVKSAEKEKICVMQFRRWDPFAQLNECRVVPLTPKCRAVLTCYHNQFALFVRPTGKQHVELRNTVLQQVAASHVVGIPLSRPPRRDEMVACKCEQDGSYYRAIVRESSRDNPGKYKVWFVDFGNTADVGLEDMKLLPEDIKNYPFLAVKVALKGVCNYKLTFAAAEYLNELLEKEEVLTVHFENSIEEGVELSTRDGTKVNTKLNTLLLPTWKLASQDNDSLYGEKIFKLDDLHPLPLIEDDKEEASEIPVIVLHVNVDEGTLLCCPANSPVVPTVTNSLNAQINEFCESPTSDTKYNPRKDEICLARHPDGSWQRALAVESIEGGSKVIYLDFGGTQNVLFRDMRRILPEFMAMPTLISVCLIQGLPAKLSDAVKEKLKELIKVDTIVRVQNVKAIEDSAEYKIDLPEVVNALQALYLISK